MKPMQAQRTRRRFERVTAPGASWVGIGDGL
jgi:hypothetical protein